MFFVINMCVTHILCFLYICLDLLWHLNVSLFSSEEISKSDEEEEEVEGSEELDYSEDYEQVEQISKIMLRNSTYSHGLGAVHKLCQRPKGGGGV